jgi:hypothetical protein
MSGEEIAGVKAKISHWNAQLMRTIFELVCLVDHEVRVNVTSESLRIAQMDPAHITMLCVDLRRNFFLDYEIHNEGIVELPVEQLVKMIRGSLKECSMSLVLEGDVLHVEVLGSSALPSRRISLKLGKPWRGEVTEPKPTFEAEITVGLRDFYDAVRQFIGYADYVRFYASTYGGFTLSSKADEREISVTFGSPQIYSFYVEGEEAVAHYDVERLYRFLKTAVKLETAVKKDGRITIQYSTDKPLKLALDSQIFDYNAEIYYLVAPAHPR